MSSHEVIFNGSGDSIDISIVGTNKIEAHNAAAIKEDLTRLVNGARTHYILNLDNIDFIDSLGLGVLVAFLKRIKAADGQLLLKGVNSQVKRLLDLTQLSSVFQLEYTALSRH